MTLGDFATLVAVLGALLCIPFGRRMQKSRARIEPPTIKGKE